MKKYKMFNNERFKRDLIPKQKECGNSKVTSKVYSRIPIQNSKCKYCGENIIWKMTSKGWCCFNERSTLPHAVICKGIA